MLKCKCKHVNVKVINVPRFFTSLQGSVTIPRQAPLANKQSAQAKKASRCLHDRRPSRQPPSPIGLATPFFMHLARPREAEKTEREKVMMN